MPSGIVPAAKEQKLVWLAIARAIEAFEPVIKHGSAHRKRASLSNPQPNLWIQTSDPQGSGTLTNPLWSRQQGARCWSPRATTDAIGNTVFIWFAEDGGRVPLKGLTVNKENDSISQSKPLVLLRIGLQNRWERVNGSSSTKINCAFANFSNCCQLKSTLYLKF